MDTLVGVGADTPILEGGRDLPRDSPMFLIFSFWIIILLLYLIPFTPSFCRQKSVFPSHLVPKIIAPKVGLIFHFCYSTV